MSLREGSRRFGKLISDNLVFNKPSNVSLVKPSKRISDGDQCPEQIKKHRCITDQENKEAKMEVKEKKDCQDKGKKDCQEPKAKESHVRKLDLLETKQQESSKEVALPRLTRSSLVKINARLSVDVPVDPKLHELRSTFNFSDPTTYYRSPLDLPENIEDYDKTQLKEISSEAHYAHDVFLYYKHKELKYLVPNYIHQQVHITKNMRSVLVDWMVEVQESFELNHETLYLAVKLVDHYLAKKVVQKDKFQLLGATCLLMAAKYDERIPPSIEDFLYICDDAYVRRDIILMEIEVFKKLNFFLGFPLSYRFLRRYARCSKLSMETLTLSRFVLETSLMEYDFIHERDSKMAAGALLLALKMRGQEWTPELAYYSGYQESELTSLMYRLNEMISCPIKSSTKTIRNKYSHPIFYEVAKTAPLPPRT